MSIAQQAKRRRRHHAIGFSHLALICGKNVKGGRPLYSGRSYSSIHESIERERKRAAAEQARKRK